MFNICWTYFTPLSSVFVVDFEQVNVSWEATFSTENLSHGQFEYWRLMSVAYIKKCIIRWNQRTYELLRNSLENKHVTNITQTNKKQKEQKRQRQEKTSLSREKSKWNHRPVTGLVTKKRCPQKVPYGCWIYLLPYIHRV